mmetsp:Transcript_15792/g.25791  ORF Transcript_15792/g.25791 Transcript_15792/m.25791 type:complete len:97 (-) Transcript_15792:680-970(-)
MLIGRSKAPNREAIRLYREILKTANCFYWPNDDGEQWSVVLKRSARKEFEEARHETDPLIVARLLVVGRECLYNTQEKFNVMEDAIKDRISKTRTS